MARKKKLPTLNDRFNKLLKQGRSIGDIRRVAEYANLSVEFVQWLETLPTIPLEAPVTAQDKSNNVGGTSGKGKVNNKIKPLPNIE